MAGGLKLVPWRGAERSPSVSLSSGLTVPWPHGGSLPDPVDTYMITPRLPKWTLTISCVFRNNTPLRYLHWLRAAGAGARDVPTMVHSWVKRFPERMSEQGDFGPGM